MEPARHWRSEHASWLFDDGLECYAVAFLEVVIHEVLDDGMRSVKRELLSMSTYLEPPKATRLESLTSDGEEPGTEELPFVSPEEFTVNLRPEFDREISQRLIAKTDGNTR